MSDQIRESVIERKHVKQVKAKGGMSLKFVSPGFRGVPDRLDLYPGGVAEFTEMKRPGEKLRALQVKRKAELEALGFKVRVIDYEV